jgi:RimJ/RimL family protein N-acetyltransferase
MTIETARLVLRRPVAEDVQEIFDRYAADPEVTRYLSWPRHTSLDDTRAFLQFSDAQWATWPTGPLLCFSRANGALLGGTGLGFTDAVRATTGYVFSRDAWGKGYATEALAAMVDLSRSLGIAELSALCHVDHRPSWRVMEKCGFTREALLPSHLVFPNLSAETLDVLRYVFRGGL